MPEDEGNLLPKTSLTTIRATTTIRNIVASPTANSSKEDRHECLVAGMDEFLVKPITPAILRALLGRIAAAL